MSITLSPALQQKVDQLIATGSYDGPEAVLEASLSLLEERERRLQWLRAELQIGEEQELRGDTVEWTPQLMAQLMDEADQRSRLGLPIDDAVKPPARTFQAGDC